MRVILALMNFLSKTLSTLTGNALPYTVKEETWRGVWTLHNGVNPKDESAVSIFSISLSDPTVVSHHYDLLAQNCYKKLKLIKFPGIINIVDFVETPSTLYIVTERVTNLSQVELSKDHKVYGLKSICESIAFLNENNYVHGNISTDAIFVNEEGDWKLFGFELLTNLTSDPDQPVYRNFHFAPVSRASFLQSTNIDSIKQFPVKFDSFLLGNLIIQLLPDWQSTVKRLIGTNFNARSTVEKFLKDHEHVFSDNLIVQFNEELKNLKLVNDPSQKLELLKTSLSVFLLGDYDFPTGIMSHKVLPVLISQYDIVSRFKPSVNTSPEEMAQVKESQGVLLNYLLKYGGYSENFKKSIWPIILSNFQSNDRSIRLVLLNNLSGFKPHLQDSDIQTIFPKIITGVQDTNFLIRELTLSSINLIVDSISEKSVNQDLLKVLAKCQNDPKPSIRTNTIILVIKISPKIYKNSRNNVIITALSKALRDSFTPCKLAALRGFENLIAEFSVDEICNKIIGVLASALMDGKSHKVRQESRRLFKIYFDVVERHAETQVGDEEDEEKEEKEFLRKFGNNELSKHQEVKESKALFGWGVVNKLVGGVEGQLNSEINKSSSSVNLVAKSPTPPVAQKLADVKIEDEEDKWDDDDGWDDTPVAPPVQAVKPKQPVVKKLPTSSRNALKLGQKTKAPGSTLKLNLVDDGEDGWNGDDDW